ncbi:hypothetical protein DPMN_042276 [Dreissena polymorpha]|uniref:B box-type domain-containing protein n=1 Tax=Dreissena polymorpha TaxID=45954 RepID=A0A9D4D0S5_DREPO|nr:hypothetical protein DPMN_042276 [Dreissena polymorpha]
MALHFESSIHKGSDLLFDCSCFTCHENDRNTEAEFYCEECSILFCDKGMENHNYLYKKHATSGKANSSLWPVSNGKLEQCKVHYGRKFEIFCGDHNELLCNMCHVSNHK